MFTVRIRFVPGCSFVRCEWEKGAGRILYIYIYRKNKGIYLERGEGWGYQGEIFELLRGE